MITQVQVRRIIERYLPTAQDRRLVLLTGFRQTGKTTLTRGRYANLSYLNLDAPENRDAVRGQPTPNWGRDIGNAIIDEAHKEPTVFDKVKYAFDDGSISFTVLLGSSQTLLLKRIRESLAGRVTLFEMFPLMLCELNAETSGEAPAPPFFDRLLAPNCDSLDKVFGELPERVPGEWDAPVRAAEKHLLEWGGMPALLSLSEEDRWQWLKDYTHTYLERDLADLVRVDDVAPYRKFQRLAALQSGRIFSLAEIARDAGIPAATATRYLEYLRMSHPVFLLPPCERNLTSSPIKTPKIYWLDMGLMRHLTGQHGALTRELYENFVVSEIIKWIRTARREAPLSFYHARSGIEVDLLVETPRGVLAIEVQSGERVDRAKLRGLAQVRHGLGKEWAGGLVVHRGNNLESLGDGIWSIPARLLLS